jgi:prolyl-tRNA synthetase
MVGAVIMAHGDDQGLRLPPRLAPTQVIMVPIYKNDDERSAVMAVTAGLESELKAAGVRVRVDLREGVSPGFKYNDWEMRGVPVRVEIGPKDVQNNTVAVARRDVSGKAGKQFLPREGVVGVIQSLLTDIQANLLAQATAFRDGNIHEVTGDYDKFRQIIAANGWVLTWFSGGAEAEAKIKEDCQAVSRCFPLEQDGGEGPCIVTGERTSQRAYFARAY